MSHRKKCCSKYGKTFHVSHKRAMYKLDENFQMTGSVLDKRK